MQLKLTLFVLVVCFGCSSPEVVDTAPPTPPNIIIMVSDDQGYGDLSLTGNPYLKTPNIDRMASEGAFFTHFYVSPVCSPTRAEMLTGRYSVRGGVYDTSAGGERLDLDEETMAEFFRDAGYATGAFGKWHNGQQYPYHPNGRGFDEFYGFAAGHWGSYFDALMERNSRWLKGEGFMPDDLTDKAIEFMKKHKDQPFLLYVPYNTPHSPMQVPEKYWEKFENVEFENSHRGAQDDRNDHTRAAYAMCENLDDNVGRVLEMVDSLGLKENTIIMYFSDNGPNGRRWNAGLRGTKGSTDEGGVRSPLVMRWPGKIAPGKEITQVSGAIDLLPTLAAMTGLEFQSQKPLDGIDVSQQILSEVPNEDRVIVSHWAGRTSVRTQQYRLDFEDQLYDIDADPGQWEAMDSPGLRDSLIQLKKDWQAQVLSELPATDTRPFPIAGTEYPITILPARDAQYTEGISRSNRWPNCSFLTEWTSTSDSIYWNIEVGETGTFEAVLHYTCSAENTGAQFSLSSVNRSTSNVVQDPFDPPLRGMEYDKFPRGESYVKDFNTISLGKIDLVEGDEVLVLKADTKTGPGLIDFRMIELTRENP